MTRSDRNPVPAPQPDPTAADPSAVDQFDLKE